MGLKLDPRSEAARDLARKAVPEGGVLDIGTLLAAIYRAGELHEELPQLGDSLPELSELRNPTPASVPVSPELSEVLTELATRTEDALTPRAWFRELLASEPGRAFLGARGVTAQSVTGFLAVLDAGGDMTDAGAGWRTSEARREAFAALGSFGRVLTEGPARAESFVQHESAVASLIRVLVKRKQRNALVMGPPGTGKTALVYELARRLLVDDARLPARLAQCDIFELSPGFLRSGASVVGEYDRRVKELLEVLRAHPRILLFVDEIHSLLQSGIHARGPFTDANESFKQALSSGEICVIGCTTTAEYRHYIAADEALAQRFSVVNLEPPSPEATRNILQSRLAATQSFYGIEIPGEMLDRVVELTEDLLPSRAQPRKSIQLLDEACAFCVVRSDGEGRLAEQDLTDALEETIGRSVVRRGELTLEGLFDQLRHGIVGQDAVLKQLAGAVVAGLGSLAAQRDGPRGVFLLGGPSGVGKTETAVRLARVLGGEREALIRVNCNMLHGSTLDSGPAHNILLGAPPGYVGYVRGKGGELSKIRDHPQSVVLFDEIEKASATISDLLLQIMDEGRCEDADGNLLDFRRSFLLFTTNAGSFVATNSIGFATSESKDRRVGAETVKAGLRTMGFHDAFLGRMDAILVFDALDENAVVAILKKGLDRLGRSLADAGYGFEVDTTVAGRLAAHWQPEFGARHLLALIDRIGREFSVAEAANELEGIEDIHLADEEPDHANGNELSLVHRRAGTTLHIALQ